MIYPDTSTLMTYLVIDMSRYGTPSIVSPVLYISHTNLGL